MMRRVTYRLTLARKALLAAAGAAAVAGPILIGVLNAPVSRAQSKTEKPAFEVASIRPADPDARGMRLQLTPGGGLDAGNVRLKTLIGVAFNVEGFQISGGPEWINSQGFDILAKPPQTADPIVSERQMSEKQRTQFQERIQSLLTERFQLVIRRDTKELPVFDLVVARGGSKLNETTGEGDGISAGRAEISGDKVPIGMLVKILSARVGRPVVDKTGLGGLYDFKLEWSPDAGDGTGKFGGPLDKDKDEGASAAPSAGPSIFTALQEQLGLKLEPQRGKIENLIIVRVEKPSEN